MLRQTAESKRKIFLNEWNKQPDIDKYEKLLDMCNIADRTYVFTDVQFGLLPLAEKVKRLEKKYI